MPKNKTINSCKSKVLATTKNSLSNYKLNRLLLVVLSSITTFSGLILSSSIVKADNASVVDEINITVPVSCTLSGTGMNTHNAEINNGIYTTDIGTTTLHAFCNDSEGFAIYATGYTGNVIEDTNSNKLVGTATTNNATIDTGIATSGNSSNWAMKLTATQDSGDTSGTNALTIDSAPNASGGADASFSQYHVVPNEYTKVAHKNSNTDMTASTGGVKLTTTYAAYISRTQPADTYTGQVIYTLVHPSSAAAPVGEGKIGVTYHANGSTFSGGGSTNNVVYASSPMYIATTPLIAKTSNIGDDGVQNGPYSTGTTLTPITATGATKMKVIVRYGLSNNAYLPIIEGNYNPSEAIGYYKEIDGPAAGEATYVFNGDAVSFYMTAYGIPSSIDGKDYGYYAEVYPIYTNEQTGTEPTSEFMVVSVDEGTYTQTTDWYGSWYADINNHYYDFIDESEVISFLSNNTESLDGATVNLYRGLTFTEAYTRANKTQDSGYYKQQDLNKNVCHTVAITQNQTVKDVRDNNTYMIGKLKDGRCWMLDNLALDPTDSTTATNMNSSNTNASAAAIDNYLHGGGGVTGRSSAAVTNVSSGFQSDGYIVPYINNQSRNTLVTSYGPASTNGQAKVGIYYNFCAVTAGTYCYASNAGVDVPGTFIDAPEDICPANWRIPTGGPNGEYQELFSKYNTTQDATDSTSMQYNLSTSLSGSYYNEWANYQNSYGYWWSSTYDVASNMRKLLISPTSVVANSYFDRAMGTTVRCLVSN